MQSVDRTETSLRANAHYSAKIIRRRNPRREYVEVLSGVSDIFILKASEVQLGEGFRGIPRDSEQRGEGARAIPSTSLRAGSSLRLKNSSVQDDGLPAQKQKPEAGSGSCLIACRVQRVLMLAKNSPFDLVLAILSTSNSIASTGESGFKTLRRTQMRCRSSLGISNSSFRVPER